MSRVVTAWAEPAAGPGWANSPVWVLIHDPATGYTVECIQPTEQSRVMRTLYGVSATVHGEMRHAAVEVLGKTKEEPIP